MPCLSAPGLAGPWAREDGDLFLSFSISGEETQTDLVLGEVVPDRHASIYAEYGLGHRLTAGLDLGWGETAQMAAAYLRRTLTAPDSRWQVALDAGIAGRWQDGADPVPLLRLGAALGYGFGGWQIGADWLPLGHQGGWMTLDATTLTDPETGDTIWQGEATIGLHMADRLRIALALKAEDWPEADLTVSARPSVIYSFTDRTAVQLGAHMAVQGSDAVGLSFSLWQEF
ncbi:hypothetical protein roselon_00477 [Roseibacterium elongatum DSM 19469]|uniref:Uncharacterized protein n=1 Tax=Roseicyclus elongatus DSM 19469 TaxID=1294273 RepID=W8RPJ7_9RHOB|nr:hypothetical protein [Roseibacterium elongatum]AHM02918.1 hypothetical protein roselon_00477 [Roseibacterium elongatum DSM 19469]